MMETIANKLSSVPKDLVPALSVGMIVVAVLFVIIFFALCVVYINSRPPVIIKKNDNKPGDISKKTIKTTKIRHEDLPIFSGRVGEILTLNNILKAGPITKIFFQVLEIIKSNTYDIHWRYNFPCFMIVGPDGSGKQTLLDNLTFEHLSVDSDEVNSMWKLFKKGAIFKFPKIDFGEDNKTFWSFLSELFVFIRPRRPLDGIIVTLPADMLMSNVHNIEQHATELFERIFSFQKEINFRLPIYIIITKSDFIPGFSEFVHLLSNKTKQQIFGWSNPHTLNTAFSSTWINEIFTVINEGVRKTIITYAQAKTINQDLEKAVLFETHLKKIEKAISIYINTMFRTHNPSDGLLLRGVYIVGHQKQVEISHDIIQPSVLHPDGFNNANITDDSSYNDELCFVQDLFSEKIFKEYNIAHPIYLDTVDITRKAFRNKVIFASTAVVTLTGWFYGNYNIKNNIKKYHGIFRNIKTTMMKITQLEANISNVEEQAVLNKYATDLLHNMPVIKAYDLFSPFVVQSWFSSLRKNIINTVSLVFDSVIIRAMYIDLNMNAKNILMGYRESDNKTSDMFDINSFPSFKKLQYFITQLLAIQKLGVEYNSVRKLENKKDIIDLTSTFFKDRFKITEEMKSCLPNKKLISPRFDFEMHRTMIEKSLETLSSDFMDSVFNGVVEKILQNITDDIITLEEAAKNTTKEYNAKDLAKLYQKTLLLHDIMNNKYFNWIKEKHFSPTHEYVELINKLYTSKLISVSFLKNLLKSFEVRFSQFKEKIRNYKTNLTDNVINSELDKESVGFEWLQKELKTLLDQPFIINSPNASFVNFVMDDKMLIWDTKRLRELSELVDKYYSFADGSSDSIRLQHFEVYKTIAKKCFYSTVQAILGKAQIFDDLPLGNSKTLLESSYKKQADNIRNTTIAITKIAKFCDEVCNDDNFKDCGFLTLIISQYMLLLEKVDHVFSLETPYSAGDELFDGWRGEKNPKYLNINADAAMKKYLTTQFNRIKFMAKDLAMPVIDLLSIPHILEKIRDQSLIEKWKEIIASVDAYEAQKPGNSIAALEDFLSNTLKNISIDSMDEQGEIKTISETDGDFFTSKRSDIAKALISRADIVMYDKAAEKYNQIETFFNNTLSNKFPFGDSEEEASLKDIENFINLYEKNSPNLVNVLRKNKERKQINDEVFNFLDSANKLIPFLKAWVMHSKNSDFQEPIFSFTVSLRPFATSEAFTSAVLDRIFRVKNTTVNDNDKAVFFNNDPVDIRFTWVSSSSQKPYERDLPPNLEIEGNTAIFSYGGRWAMFRMIEKHRVNRGTESTNGILLEFNVPVLDVSEGNNLVMAKMLFKIVPNVKSGDKVSPITWPVFLHSCPGLHENAMQQETLSQQNNDAAVMDEFNRFVGGTQ